MSIPQSPDWWPDWTGATAAIIASGPSTKKDEVELLRGSGIRCLAIKTNVDLCPWADVVYGCDAPWWRSRHGLPDYNGLKIAFNGAVCDEFPTIRKIEIDQAQDRILRDKPGVIGGGGCSGFQALNLVVQFGAKRIIGIGFDASDKDGNAHWYGRNNWAGANNPSEACFPRWRRSFEAAAPILNRDGIEFVICGKSTINNFRKASVKQILREWQYAADPV